MITRDEWGARPPSGHIPIRSMRDRIDFIVHHSGALPSQTVAAIQRYHMGTRGWSDIGYNFLIRGTTGECYIGRGWNRVGAHTRGHNTTALGVCIIGKDTLTSSAAASLRTLYQLANAQAGHKLMIRGHRDYAPTDCPGSTTYRWLMDGHLDVIELRSLYLMSPFMVGPDVRALQARLGIDVDGIFGPETSRAVIAFQEAHGLKPDGIVGPLTRAALAR